MNLNFKKMNDPRQQEIDNLEEGYQNAVINFEETQKEYLKVIASVVADHGTDLEEVNVRLSISSNYIEIECKEKESNFRHINLTVKGVNDYSVPRRCKSEEIELRGDNSRITCEHTAHIQMMFVYFAFLRTITSKGLAYNAIIEAAKNVMNARNEASTLDSKISKIQREIEREASEAHLKKVMPLFRNGCSLSYTSYAKNSTGETSFLYVSKIFNKMVEVYKVAKRIAYNHETGEGAKVVYYLQDWNGKKRHNKKELLASIKSGSFCFCSPLHEIQGVEANIQKKIVL